MLVRQILIPFGLAFLTCLASCRTGFGEKLEDEILFQSDRVVEVRIEMNEDDWRELCSQSRGFGGAFGGGPLESPYDYFKADIWIDDHKISNVGIRKKGFLGSNDNQRPSLKVDFSEYEDQKPFRNIDRLTLNNNKQDRSLTSQYLVYRLYRNAGLPAPRTGFARVSVNGQNLGVYSNVESLRKSFLKRAFGSSKGNLYEGTIADFHPKALDRIQVKTNEDDNDLSDIRELAELLDAEGDLDVDALGQIVNIDSFIRFWALEGITGFWDGYAANQNNYWVYFNPDDEGRAAFIPWGTDWNLTNGGPFNRSADGVAPLIYAQAILANRLYHSPGIPERYQQALRDIMAKSWNEQQMLGDIDRLESLLLPYVHPAQNGAADAMNEVRNFIKGRPAVVEARLADWNPEIPDQPRSPSYNVEVGQLAGTFTTQFSVTSQEGDEPSKAMPGTGKFSLTLNDQPVELSDVTVTAAEFRMNFGRFGGGGFGGPRPGGGFGGPPPGGGFGGRRPGGFGRPPGDPPSETEETNPPQRRPQPNADERPQPSDAQQSQRPGGFGGGPPRGFGGPPGGGFGGPPGGFGGPPGPPQIELVISGTNANDENVRISFNVAQDEFLNRVAEGIQISGGSVTVRAQDTGGQGGFGFGFGGPRRSLSGTLFLTSSGIKDADGVAGRLDVKISESRGGMFGGGGRGGGPPRGGFGGFGGPPRERPAPGRRDRPELEE